MTIQQKPWCQDTCKAIAAEFDHGAEFAPGEEVRKAHWAARNIRQFAAQAQHPQPEPPATPTEADLLACPFCGSERAVMCPREGSMTYLVQCMGCSARGSEQSTRALAHIAWDSVASTIIDRETKQQPPVPEPAPATPSAGAMRADNAIFGLHHDVWAPGEAAAIIDRETGLPELVAALRTIKAVHLRYGSSIAGVNKARDFVKAVLAKHDTGVSEAAAIPRATGGASCEGHESG